MYEIHRVYGGWIVAFTHCGKFDASIKRVVHPTYEEAQAAKRRLESC